MRIISGIRRGKKLLSPKNKDSRPTEDRVKEAIFNVLYPMKDNFTALDVFACTGSIGLEFISRGAKRVFFSELNRDNISLLDRNIKDCGFVDKAKVYQGDFRRNISLIRENIDYVYLDPPYKSNFYELALELMIDNPYFSNAIFICEMDRDDNFSEKYDKIHLVFSRSYGNKYIKMYKGKEDEGSISG